MAGKPELEVKTSTPELTNIREPDGSGTMLDLSQATERYQISSQKLLRKLEAGKVQSAYKVGGPGGEKWQIPVAALEVLGLKRVEPVIEPQILESPETAIVRSLLQKLDRLLDVQVQLTAGRDSLAQQNQEAQIELARTQERLSSAQSLLEEERTRREAAEAQAAAAPEVTARQAEESAQIQTLLKEERTKREAIELKAAEDAAKRKQELAEAEALLKEERTKREAIELKAAEDAAKRKQELAEADALLKEERTKRAAAEVQAARKQWPRWKKIVLWKIKDDSRV